MFQQFYCLFRSDARATICKIKTSKRKIIISFRINRLFCLFCRLNFLLHSLVDYKYLILFYIYRHRNWISLRTVAAKYATRATSIIASKGEQNQVLFVPCFSIANSIFIAEYVDWRVARSARICQRCLQSQSLRTRTITIDVFDDELIYLWFCSFSIGSILNLCLHFTLPHK